MAAIDLYSGIGGWTLGLRMAGIEVVSSNEWWPDANRTHNMNFGTNHDEVNIRELQLGDLPNPNDVDYVVGSPPCTQFSFSNRGGNGDIADGLVDIHKFLEIVEYLNPRYWAMENVPRVAKILESELKPGRSLNEFAHLFGEIKVYDSSEFGVPQRRKRMIAGNLPFELLDSYRVRTPRLNLGDVIHALNQNPVRDPIYGLELNQDDLTNNIPETPLSLEEARINSDSKKYHPIYNAMSFPDQLDRPSRTITALCTRVSRESIIIKDNQNNIRRLSVRERASLQGFPINYQFYSKSYGGKLKMIGNAVPPILTFYIAQAMQETTVDNLVFPDQTDNQIINHDTLPEMHAPDSQGRKYPWSRSFWLAIPHLRFGSGVRFELRNYHDKHNKTTNWRVNFFYGNSKRIESIPLGIEFLEKNNEILAQISIHNNQLLESLITYCERLDVEGLQIHWTNLDRERVGPIEIVDNLGLFYEQFAELFFENEQSFSNSIQNFTESVFNGSNVNKKIIDEPVPFCIGMLIGSIFNTVMEGHQVRLPLEV